MRYRAWGASLLGVALLLGVLYYLYRRKKAGKGLLPKKVEPALPPHAVALAELYALKGSSLLPEGRIKEYYVQVSEIIRRYIEGRYFIVALELTTFELIEKLRRADVETEIVQIIHDFLDRCDLVKFAKHAPNESESVEVWERAFDIVERTKLVYDLPTEDAPTQLRDTSSEPPASEVVLAEDVEVRK